MEETRNMVQRCHALTYEDLPDEVVDRAKYLLLDYLGVAARGALSESSRPVQALLRHFGHVPGGCRGHRHACPCQPGLRCPGQWNRRPRDRARRCGQRRLPAPRGNRDVGRPGRGPQRRMHGTGAHRGHRRRLRSDHSPGHRTRPRSPLCAGLSPHRNLRGLRRCGCRRQGASPGPRCPAACARHCREPGRRFHGISDRRGVHETPARRLGRPQRPDGRAAGREGFTGPASILEGRFGFLHAYSPKREPRQKVLNGWGEPYQVMRTSIKPHACCRYKQGPIDGILKIMREQRLQAADVETVALGVLRAGFALVADPPELKCAPRSIVDAQFSMPFGAAVAHAVREGLLEQYTLENILLGRGSGPDAEGHLCRGSHPGDRVSLQVARLGDHHLPVPGRPTLAASIIPRGIRKTR